MTPRTGKNIKNIACLVEEVPKVPNLLEGFEVPKTLPRGPEKPCNLVAQRATQGFRFKGGMDACTEGIWIWPGGSEVAKRRKGNF